MNPTLRQILPVIISMAIIILVAILRNYSKSLAAILATMPINIPLSLWIIYSGEGGTTTAVVDYSVALVYNIFPTVVFIIVTWLAFRAGWSLLPTLGVGYLTWAVLLGMTLLIRGGWQ